MKFFEQLMKKNENRSIASSGKASSGLAASSVRFGIIVLLVGFGGFLFWAAFAPLDEGVPCEGNVSISTRSKVVQHLRGGQVQAVHVHEGQMVQEGDLLISLADLETRSRYEEVHQQYLGLRAAESRLIAELGGKRSIKFHKDLYDDPDTNLVNEIIANQKDLFASRQSMLRSLERRLSGLRDLVAEGYAPLNDQLELQEQVANVRSQISTEMADVKVAVDAYAEKSKALKKELELVEIRSPATGQVVGLQFQTVGAVIRPGEKIMDIVPFDELLLIEVKVLPHLIDRVHTGLEANVRFSSFAHSPLLVVDGLVESISQDLLTDPDVNPMMPGARYYLARVALTLEGLEKLGDRQMHPGMPVQVVIKTGERSMLTYLLHPLIKRISASMKEE